MARKTETVTIDGERYTVTQLGAVEGMELYHELVRVFGPLVREELSSGRDVDAEGTISRILLQVVEKMPRSLARELREAFAKHTEIEAGGVPLKLSAGDVFDQHFAGRYGLLVKWMIHCLKFNFAGFLGDSKPGASPLAPGPTP